MNTELQNRLLKKASVSESGCWEWHGKIMHKGYGVLSVNNKETRAHRASYEVFVGAIPDGMVIMHMCDNRRCINPDHLKPGTHKQNVQDAVAKGRMGIGRPAKINGDLYSGSMAEAAKRLSVSVSTVRRYRLAGYGKDQRAA